MYPAGTREFVRDVAGVWSQCTFVRRSGHIHYDVIVNSRVFFFFNTITVYIIIISCSYVSPATTKEVYYDDFVCLCAYGRRGHYTEIQNTFKYRVVPDAFFFFRLKLRLCGGRGNNLHASNTCRNAYTYTRIIVVHILMSLSWAPPHIPVIYDLCDLQLPTTRFPN